MFQIHKFYNEFDEADILLRKYQDKNPDNPNAYRLLYEYLSSNSEHFDEAHVNQQSRSCLKVGCVVSVMAVRCISYYFIIQKCFFF